MTDHAPTAVQYDPRGSRKSANIRLHVKSYPKIVGIVLALIPAILLFGYDAVAVSSIVALPSFTARYGVLHGKKNIIPAMWLGIWQAASPIGIMVGAMIAGLVQEKTGRRICLILGALIGVLGIATCFGSSYVGSLEARRVVYLVGKWVEGICSGMVICTTQTYVAEIVPHVLHGAAFAIFPAMMLLGQLLGAIALWRQSKVKTPDGYLTVIASQWVLNIIVIVVAALLPESPIWLIRSKGDMTAALKAERRLQRPSVNCVGNINHLALLLEQERLNKDAQGAVTYGECLTGINRRRTLIVVFGNVMPQFFGLVLLSNASYFMQQLGMPSHQSLEILNIGIGIGLAANLAGVYTMQRFTTKPITIYTLGMCAALFLAIGIAGFWDGDVVMWWTAVSFILIIFTAGVGAWPASVLISSQASSLRLRGKTQGLGWIAHGLSQGTFSIVLPYVYNPDAGNAKGKVGFLFMGLCIIAATITWLWVPEMSGLSPQAIDDKFEMGIGAREWERFGEGEWVERRKRESEVFPPEERENIEIQMK
ncbi:MFS general substrate transporter [Venturia nashicola]|uniref:MFS general substrate transporter n=1 Tax=Venturia nashicola TaxID=86259 RepID=A0A4Z1PB47_9PEZI|nr:MFS general substrate transporter [Venturia nashicola]TLD37705.1 MFS general substrate transporter [Venturia nashicola]